MSKLIHNETQVSISIAVEYGIITMKKGQLGLSVVVSKKELEKFLEDALNSLRK